MEMGGQHRMDTPNAPLLTPNANLAVLRELYFHLQCHVQMSSSYSFPYSSFATTFSTGPAWLQLSLTCLRRPGNGHLQELHSCNMPSSRFYTAAIKSKIYDQVTKSNNLGCHTK